MAGFQYSEAPQDFTVTLTNQDEEYELAIPDGAKTIEFQARTDVAIRHSMTTGKVAGSVSPYNTLKAGQQYYKENLLLNKAKLYLASASSGIVVEVRVWI